MNINKLIFILLGGIVTLLLIVLALNLQSGEPATRATTSDMQIWILEDDASDFSDIIASFQEVYPAYKWKTIKVESFYDKRSYDLALASAFLQWKWPDIFVVNNTESSPYENMIWGIDPVLVSPNDFRLRFAPVFSQDLILSDTWDSSIDFLKGIPVWFQSLGIYYNRKYFLRPSELTTWSGVSKEIQNVANKYSGSIIPLALGNGKWVTRAPETLQALFALEWNTDLVGVDSNEVRDVVSMYQAFGEDNGDNRYTALSQNSDDSDIELFSDWKVAAIVWYPRDLLAIDNAGYQKALLFATPFPSYAGTDTSTAIEYNYFAINKESTNPDFANDFMTYISTTEWQQQFVDTYSYYLSPETSILLSQQEKKILPSYNIVYKNFIEEGTDFVSFNVATSSIYSSETRNILDTEIWAHELFSDLKNFLVCANGKQTTLQSLSSPCK